LRLKGSRRRSKRQVLRMPAPSLGQFAPVRCRRLQNYQVRLMPFVGPSYTRVTEGETP